MFDIVIDYPDSTNALHDLKVSNDVFMASHPNNCGVLSGMFATRRSAHPARSISA